MRKLLKKIRDSKIFEIFIASIIIFSSIMVGITTYTLPNTIVSLIHILNYAITIFFLIELAIKMIAEEKFLNFFKQGWNVFDFIIVVISIIPLDGSEYALVARLLRLFRIMRLISFIPELRVLITALFTALPRMGYIALLMFIIFYIYAIIGNMLFEDINKDLWGNLGVSLLTLFRVSTFEDWTDVMYETMQIHPLSWIYYITFIFLSAFVFLNMMIGVVLETLSEEHDKIIDSEHKDDEEIIKEQLKQINAKLDKLMNK